MIKKKPKKRQPLYNLRHVPATTWLSCGQFERLKAIAEANGVTVCTFLRSIVVDALFDEATGFSCLVTPDGQAHYRAHPRKLKSTSASGSCLPSSPVLVSPLT